MGILDRLARGTARFDDLLADNALGHARSWLGSELRGEAIPARLRDVASRIAALIDPHAVPSASSGPSTHATQSVVSLEDALAAKAARAQPELLPSTPTDGAHARDLSGGVCPFTGLRADGTLAVPAAAATPPTVEARGSAREPVVEARGSAREPAVEARGSAREPSEDAPAPAREQNSEIPAAPTKPRRKSKERLAGAQTVENTSARSATRPARKQSRSRVQPSRKKA